jgi:signal peptidase I
VGDQILVTPYFRGRPERGHVVVFQHEDELLVKRVVAVPGDLIDSRLGRVRIGEHTLPEPYVLRPAASGAIASQIIPSDCYYVLGDNRDDSFDSRAWGVVPRQLIVGRARLVLWSMTSDGVARASEPSGSAPRARRSAGRLFKWVE